MKPTKEIVLDVAIKAIKDHGYIMSSDVDMLRYLDELCDDGLLLRADKAGERNPVDYFNASYTYIEA